MPTWRSTGRQQKREFGRRERRGNPRFCQPSRPFDLFRQISWRKNFITLITPRCSFAMHPSSFLFLSCKVGKSEAPPACQPLSTSLVGRYVFRRSLHPRASRPIGITLNAV
jgi:hypothetical protein